MSFTQRAPESGDCAAKLQLGTIFLLIAMVLFAAVEQDLRSASPTDRTTLHAIPVALSQIHSDWPNDYTANENLATDYHANLSTVGLYTAIKMAGEKSYDATGGAYFWYADDRGFADYVYMAFRIFGESNTSLFDFYFLILILSVMTFLSTYHQNDMVRYLCAVFLVSFFLCIQLWRHTYLVNQTPISISESRMFSIIAALPLLHLFYFSLSRSSSITRAEISGLLLQILIIGFLIHCRSSLKSDVLLFMAVVAGIYVARIVSGTLHRPIIWRRPVLSVLALMTVCFAAVPAYHANVFHPAYKSEGGSRTVWHNLVIGLSYNTYFQNLTTQDGSDRMAIHAVLRASMEDADKEEIVDKVEQALNSLSNHDRFDWKSYEEKARKYYLDLIDKNREHYFRMILLEKPVLVLSYYKYLFFPEHFLEKYGHKWTGSPRMLEYLGYSFVISILVGVVFRRLGKKMLSGPYLFYPAALACGLFLVPVIFYPMITTIAGSFFYVAFLFYALVTSAIAFAANRILSR